MMLDPLEIVAGTADAVVATDQEGRIVIWNPAAERQLGHGAAQVLGKPCHEVLCGRDVFGNPFCDQSCVIKRMAERHDAVRSFVIDIHRRSGDLLRVAVSVVVVPGPRPSQHTILHLLQPLEEAERMGLTTRDVLARGGLPHPLVVQGSAPPPVQLRSLTPRELEILRLLATGSNKHEIADSLFISVTTVRNHIQNILRKLEVHSKLEAVSLALRSHAI